MRRRRKKKHPVRKFLRNLLAVLLCIFVVVCVFFGVKGYQMYKEAVAEKPISERVEEIHGMEGVTPYSELPQFYIDATISVEDHRFEEHCGIDLIAIGRAALELESGYTKEEIFELYVNTSYFGNGYYGVGETAAGYFGKPPSELSEYECVMLAGIPNAPSVYSPDGENELAMQRTEIVLDSMVRNKIITWEDAERIKKEE